MTNERKNRFGHSEKTDSGPGEKMESKQGISVSLIVELPLILRESLKARDRDRAAGNGERNRQKGTWD